MKQYRFFYILSYVLLCLSVIFSVLYIILVKNNFEIMYNISENIIIIFEIVLSTICILMTFIPKALELMNKENKKEMKIYISYSNKDADIQQRITKILEKELTTKYVIQSVKKTEEDSENISLTPDSYIIVVSSNYVQDDNCINECNSIIKSKKKFYPIVIDSYRELNKLPDDVCTVKSAFIKNNENPKAVTTEISSIAKEIMSSRQTVPQAS